MFIMYQLCSKHSIYSVIISFQQLYEMGAIIIPVQQIK